MIEIARYIQRNCRMRQKRGAFTNQAVAREPSSDSNQMAVSFSRLGRDQGYGASLVNWLDSLRKDAIFEWRQLRKAPISSVAVIISLGLAMGACVSAFRLIDGMLLRPLPVAHPERLFVLTYPNMDATGKTRSYDLFGYPQFRALRASVKADAELIAISMPGPTRITFGFTEEKIWRQWVSGWMFGSLGLKPAVGRLLTSGDDVKPGANAVAVLSYDYWTRRFGQDRNIIGRTFRMGGNIYEIVGVCQKGFTGTETGIVTDIFTPTMMNQAAIDNPDWTWFRVWVQLRRAVALEAVRERLRAAFSIFRRTQLNSLRRRRPVAQMEGYVEPSLSLEPASAGVSRIQKEYSRSLIILGIIVASVLLIACSNIVNLSVAQTSVRTREMALRASIGAGRGHLLQLMMIQSLLIAGSAAIVGGLFAVWSAPFVVGKISSYDIPVRLSLPADWRVLGFGALLTFLVAVLVGIIPALRASAITPSVILRSGANPHSRMHLSEALVAVQVGFCILVLFITGLLVATFDHLAHQGTGFAPDRLLLLETITENNQPQPTVYWEQVREHLRSVRGVESVAISSWALMSGITWTSEVRAGGQIQRHNDYAYCLGVSPGWLNTMRIPLIDGRDFNNQDTFPASVIVNETFARRYFRTRNAVGRTFEMTRGNAFIRAVVVGYVRDARYRDMREPILPTVYVPFPAPNGVADTESATFVVRASNSNPLALARLLRLEVSRARSGFQVVNIRTQTGLIEQHTTRERLLAMLSVFFATVALILGSIGAYGVLNYSVMQRRREIALRIALGAHPSHVAWRVAAELIWMSVLGAGAGIAAGLVFQRYLASILYEVKATDPAILALPVLSILVAVLIAATPPIISALRTEPAVALRTE